MPFLKVGGQLSKGCGKKHAGLGIPLLYICKVHSDSRRLLNNRVQLSKKCILVGVTVRQACCSQRSVAVGEG